MSKLNEISPVQLKNNILFNLFNFINHNDISKDDYLGEYHLDNRLRPSTPCRKWYLISENFNFSPLLCSLFTAFNDSIRKEHYSNSHILKSEIENLFEVDENYLFKKGEELLDEFETGCQEYDMFNQFTSDLRRDWEENKLRHSRIITNHLEEVSKYSYSCDVEVIKIELFDSIPFDKIRHPYFVLNAADMFFRFIGQQ